MSDKEFINALREQLATWSQERTDMAARIGLLDKQIEAARVLLNGTTDPNQNPGKKESFSARIRRILQSKGPSTPKQIAEAMLAEGVVWNHKYDLTTAINADLYRQKKSGSLGVESTQRGIYQIEGKAVKK